MPPPHGTESQDGPGRAAPARRLRLFAGDERSGSRRSAPLTGRARCYRLKAICGSTLSGSRSEPVQAPHKAARALAIGKVESAARRTPSIGPTLLFQRTDQITGMDAGSRRQIDPSTEPDSRHQVDTGRTASVVAQKLSRQRLQIGQAGFRAAQRFAAAAHNVAPMLGIENGQVHDRVRAVTTG